LRVKRDWRATSPPPHASFFPSASDKNFEIAIKLKIVQKSDNKNSGVDTTPQGQALKVMPWGTFGCYETDTRINFRNVISWREGVFKPGTHATSWIILVTSHLLESLANLSFSLFCLCSINCIRYEHCEYKSVSNSGLFLFCVFSVLTTCKIIPLQLFINVFVIYYCYFIVIYCCYLLLYLLFIVFVIYYYWFPLFTTSKLFQISPLRRLHCSLVISTVF
jgi:hypothetical protein